MKNKPIGGIIGRGFVLTVNFMIFPCFKSPKGEA